MDELDLEHRFLPRRSPDEKNGTLTGLDHNFYELALKINSAFGDGREKSLAITTLETAAFWVKAGIERGA